jgi:predicted AAA+ superfamily ATPase
VTTPSGGLRRSITPRVHEALDDTRIVMVQGARQVGKSTLAQTIVEERGGVLVTLDDRLAQETAEADPHGFVAQNRGGLLAIDEVQRAPRLITALKLAVDQDPTPGRFLITGSANLLHLPAAQDSLAGRAETVELYGLSQGELAGRVETFVDFLFSGQRLTGHRSALTRADYLERACAGGYPEALQRAVGRRRSAWFRNYVARLVERDAQDVSGLQRLAELPQLLTLVAARNATELVKSSLAADAGIPANTLPPYLRLLETLYLTHRIPGWSTRLSARAVSRPKLALLDTGLAASLVNVSAAGAGPAGDPQHAGRLLEGFVAGELRKQLGWSEESATMYHYRDRNGPSVDLVLETPDGRVAALQVKAGSTVTSTDTRWLSVLREELGDRFVAGVVLHTGQTAVSVSDRVWAAPIEILWTT